MKRVSNNTEEDTHGASKRARILPATPSQPSPAADLALDMLRIIAFMQTTAWQVGRMMCVNKHWNTALRQSQQVLVWMHDTWCSDLGNLGFSEYEKKAEEDYATFLQRLPSLPPRPYIEVEYALFGCGKRAVCTDTHRATCATCRADTSLPENGVRPGAYETQRIYLKTLQWFPAIVSHKVPLPATLFREMPIFTWLRLVEALEPTGPVMQYIRLMGYIPRALVAPMEDHATLGLPDRNEYTLPEELKCPFRILAIDHANDEFAILELDRYCYVADAVVLNKSLVASLASSYPFPCFKQIA